MKKVVIDTNVLISGLLFGGNPGELNTLWNTRIYEREAEKRRLIILVVLGILIAVFAIYLVLRDIRHSLSETTYELAFLANGDFKR